MNTGSRPRRPRIARPGMLRTVVAWMLALVVVVFVLGGLGLAFPIQIILTLVVGWMRYVMRTLPSVTLDPELIAIGLVSLALLALGSHRFSSWLHAAMGRGAWRGRWTITGVAAMILLFVAGIASIGIVHQALWLSRERMTLSSGWSYRVRSNLRSLGTAVESYAHDHGRVPAVGDGTVASLRSHLEPTYIRLLPLQDGWGQPLYWLHRPGQSGYSIVALGKDQLPDPVPNMSPDQGGTDIYYSDGTFTSSWN